MACQVLAIQMSAPENFLSRRRRAFLEAQTRGRNDERSFWSVTSNTGLLKPLWRPRAGLVGPPRRWGLELHLYHTPLLWPGTDGWRQMTGDFLCPHRTSTRGLTVPSCLEASTEEARGLARAEGGTSIRGK